MEQNPTVLDRFYRPLFILFLVGVVVLAYLLGKHDARIAQAHGVVFACDSQTLDSLSMKSALTASVAPQASKPALVQTTAHNFVASKNGTKYYPNGCSAANRIKPENQIWFATEEDATLQGYSRTTSC
jgi:hypothetical protein